ncbi:MAG: hypothetical protein Q8K93_09395 [Reyranella sp.]|uniref:VpaChn25_0724 family phage protein n=1 Tax=Reyranella sp. TaxID=1929291 RepID=UPI00272FF772|nr:hypothetical protein [Reyranella sp.]MDP1962402.1 hypothetical protein [Reyranella sp.]MDP2376544.1 hypothetical protein [Reyranella sp.]
MSGSRFASFLAEDRRLVILKLLVEAGGGASESVIEKGLRAMGHRVGVDRDAVRADFTFLVDAGCIEAEWPTDRVQVAAITRRGVACAEGRIAIDGVAEPSMGR